MRDKWGRTIDYLRVSLTDRCNFRCLYCMPPEGVTLLPHDEILSYEEILRIVRVLAKHGLKRVRLTGGEPLLRRGIVDFVRQLSMVKEILDISLTTNGSLLAGMADDLKNAGLKRINISLDTADSERFAAITGGLPLDPTLRGLEAALSAGLAPVKLNVVVTEHLHNSDLEYFLMLIRRTPVAVRFIEYMPMNADLCVGSGMSLNAVKEKLKVMAGALFTPVLFNQGGGPAHYFTLPGAKGMFGFIAPISEHFCAGCNRIRLTSDGKIKPCLLSDLEIDVKTALRSGVSDTFLAQLLLDAVGRKPSGHQLSASGAALSRQMPQIGG